MANKKIVLIVEDEASLRNVLRDQLVQDGFSVMEAKNGAAGLKMALDSHPDLILLDLVMPVMDGLTMLKKLRREKWGKTAPVIILTNLVSKNPLVNQYLTQTHHTYFLEKSNIKIDEVVVKVRERLSEHSLPTVLPPIQKTSKKSRG